MLDLIAIGETMVAFIPQEPGALRYVQQFGKKIAGAESNVAIAAAKLGHASGWISKLGQDEFGEFVLRELRGEGVDTSCVVRTSEHPTGIMFKQFNAGGESSVTYYRNDSAASNLSYDDIDEAYIRQARIVHISGITPVLSESCASAVERAISLARSAGVKVSFDPNIRLKLRSAQQYREALLPILPQCDIILLGQDEGLVLFGCSAPEEIIAALRGLGVENIAVKLGADGAIVADRDTVLKIPAVKAAVVDTIGAGDAFNAGFLCGVLEGCPLRESGQMGALMGALAVSTYGDVEGLPDRRAFDQIRKKASIIYR